jgi:hypothetical protein
MKVVAVFRNETEAIHIDVDQFISANTFRHEDKLISTRTKLWWNSKYYKFDKFRTKDMPEVQSLRTGKRKQNQRFLKR